MALWGSDSWIFYLGRVNHFVSCYISVKRRTDGRLRFRLWTCWAGRLRWGPCTATANLSTFEKLLDTGNSNMCNSEGWVCVWVCVCVCLWERERERECSYVFLVCVNMSLNMWVCACACACAFVCACACACACACVCVRVHLRVNGIFMSEIPHLFQAAHKVVADRRAGQVSGAWTASHVEEVIRAQHGVVLLSVARGGENAIHRYRHLFGRNNRKWQRISSCGLSRFSFCGAYLLSAYSSFLPCFYVLCWKCVGYCQTLWTIWFGSESVLELIHDFQYRFTGQVKKICERHIFFILMGVRKWIFIWFGEFWLRVSKC